MKDEFHAAPGRGGRTVLVLMAIVLGTAAHLAAFEFEYWPKALVRVPLDRQWQLSIEEWLSFPDNATRFKDSQTDLWLYYQGPADWLGLGIGYKRVFTKSDDGWGGENRPMFDVALRTKLRGFGVVDRSRFEYRMPEDDPDYWRYRHKLTITSPVTFTPLQILPYTADEVFYSFDGQGFNQYRLYGGVFLPLCEKVRLELFYIWKLDHKADDWQPSNVLGTWVYFQF